MISFVLNRTTLCTRSCFSNLQGRLPSISFSSVRHQSQQSSSTGEQLSNKKGVIVEKSPVKILCEEGKLYAWCACGLSVKQPFCDGTHKKSACGLKPVRFTAPKTKEYFLCNCKQTNKQPFCDGTHKKL